MTTVLIGASSVGQLEQNIGALDNLDFADDELAAIDQHAVDSRHRPLEGPADGLSRQRSRCGSPAVTSQTRGDAAATRALSTPSSSRNRRPDGVAGHDAGADLVAHRDHAAAGGPPTRRRARRPPRRAGRRRPGASDQTPQSSMTRASQVVRQSTSTGGPGRPRTAGRSTRLDRPPGRRPAGPVQGHPVGPLGVAAVGHQPAGHVVDVAAPGRAAARRRRTCPTGRRPARASAAAGGRSDHPASMAVRRSARRVAVPHRLPPTMARPLTLLLVRHGQTRVERPRADAGPDRRTSRSPSSGTPRRPPPRRSSPPSARARWSPATCSAPGRPPSTARGPPACRSR